jgi:hypothetical protein
MAQPAFTIARGVEADRSLERLAITRRGARHGSVGSAPSGSVDYGQYR